MSNTIENTRQGIITPEAVALAEAVMKAAGSSLRHYMPQSKEKIIAACQQGIEQAQADLLEALKSLQEDVRMLRDGEWVPDEDSCQASIDLAEKALAKARRAA